MRFAAIALLTLGGWTALAQNAEFLRKTTFENRPALIMNNDRMVLTILTTGGSLANLVLADDPDKL